MRVYHFLPEQWAIDDIVRRRLKISLLEDLNDPFEMMGIDAIDAQARLALESTRRDISKRYGVLCFSRKWENPILWSHYADKHRGMALGFDISDPSKEQVCMEVSYVTTRAMLSIGELQSETGMRKLLTTKFHHWRYEDECRVFVSLEEKDSDGLYYVSFSDSLQLREVIIGVRSQIDPTNVRDRLSDFAVLVEVIQARLDPNKFLVVR